jgi:hypothetical protein
LYDSSTSVRTRCAPRARVSAGRHGRRMRARPHAPPPSPPSLLMPLPVSLLYTHFLIQTPARALRQHEALPARERAVLSQS